MRSTVICPHCGDEVPRAAFCHTCGRPLPAATANAATTTTATEPTATSGQAEPKASAPARRRFEVLPGLEAARMGRYRRVGALGLAVVLVALLAGSAAIALVVALTIVPFLFVRFLADVDVYEEEPWPALAASVVWGVIVGAGVSLLNAWLVDRFWLAPTPLRVGATGFSGEIVPDPGAPDLAVLFLSGIVVPLLGAVLMMGGPIGLRRWRSFRNEVMDGLTFGAAAGAGFAAASAVVYWWPFIADGRNPNVGVADWTATLLGLIVVRPVLFSTIGALIGAGVWHYALSDRANHLAVPLVAGVGGAILYAMGTLLMLRTGTRVELLWSAIAALALGAVLRLILRGALTYDRRALGAGGATIGPNPPRRLLPEGLRMPRMRRSAGADDKRGATDGG
jgi:RsiW-degrading membrane proteinase PrsW (M82 family)